MSMLDRMLDALTSAYNSKSSGKIGKLFSLLAGSLDDLDRTFSAIREWRDVDKAQGRTLDLMGRNFGVAREGMPDSFLRLLIKVKMAAHLSGGDIDTVINAVASLYEIEPEQLTLEEIFPAKIQLTSAPNALTEEQIAMGLFYHRFIKRIIAAGVGLIIVMQTETPMPDIMLGVRPVALAGSYSSTTLPWVDFDHKFDKRLAVVPQAASISETTVSDMVSDMPPEDPAERRHYSFSNFMEMLEYTQAKRPLADEEISHILRVNHHAQTFNPLCGGRCKTHPFYCYDYKFNWHTLGCFGMRKAQLNRFYANKPSQKEIDAMLYQCFDDEKETEEGA